MQTILVAADDSDRATPALQRAMALAAQAGARLLAVTALAPGAEDPAAAQAALLAQLADCPAAGKVDFRAEALLGPPAEVVPAAARAAGAGLMVLGLHRPRALDVLRPTTMERILLAAPVPALLARAAPAHPYARLLALTAFAPACAAALTAARALAPAAEVEILHALRLPLRDRRRPEVPAARAEAAAAEWLQTPGLPVGLPPVMVVPGGLAELIALAVEEFGPDLLALGAARRGDGTLGHTVRDLIRDPPADLLVARG